MLPTLPRQTQQFSAPAAQSFGQPEQYCGVGQFLAQQGSEGVGIRAGLTAAVDPIPDPPGHFMIDGLHKITPLTHHTPHPGKNFLVYPLFFFVHLCYYKIKNSLEGCCMPRTSDKAEKILDYVNQFVQENGYAPSVREIGAAVGLRSTASVSYHIQQLQEKGMLMAPGAKGRKRAIVTNTRPGQIPVVGVVTAGIPILAVENQEGTMAWEGDPSCFALRVRGDSMINAGILSGDKVVVRPQQTADDGQIVVAMIGDEATVKRLRRRKGEIWLLPENDNYEPIDGTDAQIIGLVKAVVREY